MAAEIEAEYKAAFTVKEEPKVVFSSWILTIVFIGVPFIGIDIECINELEINVLELVVDNGISAAYNAVSITVQDLS